MKELVLDLLANVAKDIVRELMPELIRMLKLKNSLTERKLALLDDDMKPVQQQLRKNRRERNIIMDEEETLIE